MSFCVADTCFYIYIDMSYELALLWVVDSVLIFMADLNIHVVDGSKLALASNFLL